MTTLRDLADKPALYTRYHITVPTVVGPIEPQFVEPAPDPLKVRVWHIHNPTGTNIYLDLDASTQIATRKPPF